jgi:hypothetical protein
MQAGMTLVRVTPKIAGHTLMTKQVTILTTDVKSMTTMDVSEDNPVFNISRNRLPLDRKIGAVSWVAHSNSLEESRIKVLRHVIRLILQSLMGFKLWLLMGHSALQPDNRITRHRKLWGSMKARGVEISHSGTSFEEMVKYDDKLKYFGAKEISELSAESVVKALAEEHCAYLAVLPESTDLKEMIEHGWNIDGGFDNALLDRVSSESGLLLKAVGEFDDVECGFVAVGEDELIKKIA